MTIAINLLALALAQAAPPTLAPELQPLSPLVGHCWRGTFPGTSQTDTHCWSMLPGGRQLRDRHEVAGAPSPYSGETIYRWDREARRIRYDYYASDGGFSSGFVDTAPNGLSFPAEHYLAADGRRLELRNALTWESPTAYVGVSEMRRGEAWQQMWRMRFERVSAEATP
jgi:hypothetical protein